MEQTNLGEWCLRSKQTEILLNVWGRKDVNWSLNLAYCQILEIVSHSGSSFNKVKDNNRERARDTATYMNMTVDLDTDSTYKGTTEKAAVVVSPLNALILDQMERCNSLKAAKRKCTPEQCFVTIIH